MRLIHSFEKTFTHCLSYYYLYELVYIVNYKHFQRSPGCIYYGLSDIRDMDTHT